MADWADERAVELVVDTAYPSTKKLEWVLAAALRAARDTGLEEGAQWHDKQAVQYRDAHAQFGGQITAQHAAEHKRAAIMIRALKSEGK